MSAGVGTSALSLVQNASRVSRSRRSPEHAWHVRTPPYCIQTVCAAPVLAGETLKRISWQARVVSDPVKNPLIGWWHEYYWYYVKLRDIAHLSTLDNDTTKAAIEAMLLDPAAGIASLKSTTANVPQYRSTASHVPWAGYATMLIIEKYFRDEGETINTAEGLISDTGASGYPWYLAQVNRNHGLHSAVLDAEYDAPADPGLTVGADGLFTMQELDVLWRRWQLERAQGMTQLSFEDYQRAQGVSVRDQSLEEGFPEELRYTREFTYPANTVLSGSVNSALSWSIKESADKDRFFREPGFVIGLSVSRPKVYFSGQTAALSNFLDDAISWLPQSLSKDAYSAMKEFASAGGPVPGASTSYWVDMRDLFVYGDQWVNFAMTETNAGLVALPTAGMQKRYPALADINGLFSTSTSNKIRQDGIAKLEILGTVRDLTQRT